MLFPYSKREINLNHLTMDQLHYLAVLENCKKGLFLKTCIIFYLTIIFYTSINLASYLTTQQFFHNIWQAFDNKMFSCIVFCDVSKAFDRVWHKGILLKLRQNALKGNF